MQSFETSPTVTVTRDTNVSAEAIWQVLADLRSLPEWAPGIDGAEMATHEPFGVGAVRKVDTAQFGTIEHHVTDWREGVGFAYKTADSGPFSRTLTTYSIEPKGSAATVSVALAFEAKPGAIGEDQARAVLNKGLTATLQALELRARMIQPA